MNKSKHLFDNYYRSLHLRKRGFGQISFKDKNLTLKFYIFAIIFTISTNGNYIKANIHQK